MGLFGLSLPKKVDNILGAVQAQINPFDHGATYNTVRQGVQPVQQTPVAPVVTAPPRQIIGGTSPQLGLNPTNMIGNSQSVINKAPAANQNDLSALISHIVGGVISPVTNTAGLIGNDARLAAARVTNNPVALQNATVAGQKNLQGLVGTAQSIARTLPEAATSLTGKQTTYHPNTPIEQAIFGKTPVQNIEKNVANNYDTHAGLNPLARVGLAGADLVGQVAQVAPVVGTAGKLAKLAGIKDVGNLGLSTKDVGGKANVPEVQSKPKFASIDEAFKEMAKPKEGKQGVMLSKSEIKQVNDLFANHPDPINQQFRGKIYGQFHNSRDVILGHANGNTVVLELDKNGIPTGRVRSHATPLNPENIVGDFGKAKITDKTVGQSKYDLPSAQPTQGAIPSPEVPDFLKTDPNYVSKSPDELYGRSPAEQKALMEKPVQLAPAAENTAKNSFKSVRQDVKQGDYGAVISNEQAIAKPIDTIGGQWASAVKKLAPEEKANFWKAVEDPKSKGHSPELQKAINLWRQADDRIHANSQALGGNTNYLTDHALHPWQLPEEYTNHIINGGNPDKFTGINSISRKYRTIAEGEAAGLKLGEDPIGEGSRYLKASSALLRRASLKQDIAQADSGEEAKGHTLVLGNNHNVPVSEAGMKALRGVQADNATNNALIKGARTANVGLKSTLLSGGQFHPINISLLRAVPTLIATGHPLAAAKGLYGTFRAAFGSEYAQRVIGKAIDDGTVDKAAKIGMPYGGGGYDTSGSFIKGGVGHHTVFEKQMPMMHDQVVRSILADLEKKDISLDSEAARRAGASGNRLMGFINKEAAGISPGVQRAMGDWLLAGQFTPSKIGQVKAALTPASYKGGGVAGKYAVASVAANVAATAAILTGIGYAYKQKSDDAKDLLLRALVNPAVPTPMKDSKGNTINLRTPGTDTSDISKLLGIKLVRQDNGHLGISWNPTNLPSTLEDFARARLGPLASAAVKLKTNTSFSSKPLYDPNAQGGKKAIQAATSIITGDLPIGAQGAAYTKAVKDRLPGSSREVLNASTPGSNPVIKSVGSSFGLSPATDTTTGKGLQSTQYFDQLAKAKQGLTAQDQTAFDSLFNSKKNPVTGKYDNPANVWDSGAKATQLLDHPQVLAAAVKMNQALQKSGQAIDPLYKANLTDKQRQTFLSYTAQTEPATKAEMRVENPWINDLNNSRSQFFDGLPPGDPNKPKNPIPYPTASSAVTNLQNQYYGISDPTQKAAFIANNPDLATQFAAEDTYNRSVRDAKNLPQYDSYPTASPDVQKTLDQYEALPKANGPNGTSPTRSAWITANPAAWNKVTTYLTQTSLYNLEQSAQSAAFQKQGFDQKGLKAISSLGQYDIGKTTDANGNTIYAIAPGSGSSSGGYYQNQPAQINVAQFMKRIPVSGGATLPHGGAKVVRGKSKKISPRVAIKSSKGLPKTKKIKLA